MLDKFKNIYYRGIIDYCNYKCPYCPFSKNDLSENKLEKDIYYLDKFKDELKNTKKDKDIFILPYGEAMIFEHYMDFIIEIMAYENIKSIMIQTNLSFNIDKLIERIKASKVDRSKLVFWSSFHPSQVTIGRFLENINKLDGENINYTIGSVADYKNKDLIVRIRNEIPKDRYYWLNDLDGKLYDYKKEEVNFFMSIDPYFILENNKPKSDMDLCTAGQDSILMDYDGKLKPCNRSRTLCANLYKKEAYNLKCRSLKCSCFLSYSNRLELKEKSRLNRKRMIEKIDKKLIFFDIDGTLINKEDKLEDDLKEELLKLKKDNLLILNTALPIKIARRKLGNSMELFSGGVYSNGGYIELKEPIDFKYKFAFEFKMDKLEKNFNITDRLDGEILKILVYKNQIPKELLKELEEEYNIWEDGKFLYINDKHASKEDGINLIARILGLLDEDISFFGNSENDILKGNIENIIVKDSRELLLKLK